MRKIHRQDLGEMTSLPMYLDDPTNYTYDPETRTYKSDKKNCPKALHYYKSIGITCLSEMFDGLMVEAYLPKGWSTKPNGGSCWVDVVDDKSRVRFSYFCKINWYSNCAYTKKKTRYNIYCNYDIYKWDSNDDKVCQFQVCDGYQGEVLFETEIVTIENKAYTFESLNDKDKAYHARLAAINADNETEKKQRKECERWLNKNFPKWRSYTAYFD